MARAQGARAQMALTYETVYGTPPVSGFRLMPFALVAALLHKSREGFILRIQRDSWRP